MEVKNNNDIVLIDFINEFYENLEKDDFLYNFYDNKKYFDNIAINFNIDNKNNNISIYELNNFIKTDNTTINKILLSFSTLYIQTKSILYNNNKILNSLILYGEKYFTTDNNNNSEILITNFLYNLDVIYISISPLLKISQNILLQLLAIYNKDSSIYNKSFKKNCLINLYYPYNCLCKIFSFFLKIDLIMKDNKNLKNDFKNFLYLLLKIKNNYNKINLTENNYNNLVNLINKYNNTIFTENLLNLSVDVIYNNIFDKKNNNNNIFKDNLKNYVLNTIDKCINNNNGINFEKLFNILSLIPLLKKIFNNDNKDYDNILIKYYSILEKIYFISLNNIGIDLNIKNFILSYINDKNIIYYLSPKNPLENFKNIFKEFINNYYQNIQNAKNNILIWINNTNYLNNNIIINYDINNTNDILIYKNNFIKGYKYLLKLYKILIFTLSSYLNLNEELKENIFKSLLINIELIMLIKETLFNNNIINKIDNILKYLLLLLSQNFEKLKNNINSYNINNFINYNYIKDIKSAIDIIIENLKIFPLKKHNFLIIKECYDIIKDYVAYYYNDNDKKIKKLMYEINIFLNINKKFNKINFGFLYWFRKYFKIILNFIVNDNNNLYDINYIFKAFAQSIYIFLEVDKFDCENYKNKIFELIENFCINIAKKIDFDARIIVNSINISTLNFSLNDNNFVDNNNIINNNNENLIKYINYKNIEIYRNKIVNIKDYVEKYLTKFYYEMNAININDFKIYIQMKNFIKLKYNIDLIKINNFLPINNINKELDIISLIVNIYNISLNYHYNLNENFLIEDFYNNNINNIAIINVNNLYENIIFYNIGVINSIINKIYQIVVEYIKNLTDIILDDYIQSILYQEKNMFNNNVKENIFSINEAKKILNENEEICNDIIKIITNIGNLLGLIRIINNAIMEYINDNNFKFNKIYNNDVVNKIGDIIIEDNKINSINNISNYIIQNVTNSLINKNKNYLKIILDTFDKKIFEKYFSELKLINYLIPSLCINHINNLLKNRINLKKNNNSENNGYFTDDGFIMGMTFIIKLFNIEKEFEFIGWFQQNNNKQENNNNKEEKNNFSYNEEKENIILKKELLYLSYLYDCISILFN